MRLIYIPTMHRSRVVSSSASASSATSSFWSLHEARRRSNIWTSTDNICTNEGWVRQLLLM